jgi:hypothetical protein
MKTGLAVSSTSFALSLLLVGAPRTSRADNLFVANYFNNTLDEISSSGTVTVFASAGMDFPFGSSVLNSPMGLAFDNSGDLFVANNNNNTIAEFNSAGVGRTFATVPGGPYGVAFSAGDLYVINYAGSIEKFNSSGVGTAFASTGYNYPAGLAFDSSGNLYVSNLGNGTIEEFNANGVGTVFASGLGYASGLAFEEAIPEPSTWALLAMSMITLLGVLRLRHRSF